MGGGVVHGWFICLPLFPHGHLNASWTGARSPRFFTNLTRTYALTHVYTGAHKSMRAQTLAPDLGRRRVFVGEDD